MGTADGDN